MVRFDYGNGRDTILDFHAGEDRVDFSWTDMTAAVLQANAYNVPDGVFLALGSGSILLAGINLADLDFGRDFLFAH